MNINITGHHVDVTASIRNYIENKMEKLERHFEHVKKIHVILTMEKDFGKAEATIHVNRGDIYADAKHEDMYTAIDSLIGKLDRQIKKHKEKLTNHHRGDAGLKDQETV